MRRQTYHHPDLLKDVAQKGIDAIRKTGELNLSIRSLSKELKVSHNAVYHHFKNKEHLTKFLVNECFKLFALSLQAKVPAYDGLDNVTALGLRYFHFCKMEPQLYKFMFSHRQNSKKYLQDEAAKNAFNLLLGLSNGSKEHARFLWSVVHGLCDLLLSDMFSDMSITDPDIDEKVAKLLSSYGLYDHAKRKSI